MLLRSHRCQSGPLEFPDAGGVISLMPVAELRFEAVKKNQRADSFAIKIAIMIARAMMPIGSVQNLSHIWSGDGFGLRDLRLIERPHVHVALG
jgi:hypothetical protein